MGITPRLKYMNRLRIEKANAATMNKTQK